MPSVDRPRPLPPAALLHAARRVMRPFVRLMMHSGITFPVVADTLRKLFIDVAVNEILTDPKTRTDSRISLLTGVHRKEIKRLRQLPADASAEPDVITLAAQVVGRWLGTPGYVDSLGRPLPLSRFAASGAAPSFDSLIESITSDIRPRAVLDDLIDHGIVTIDSDDRVRLTEDAFIPRPGGEEQLFYFARNLHDHIAAAVANVSAADAPPYLNRSVHYDRLTPAQAASLKAVARIEATKVLLEVNRRAIEIAAGDPAAEPEAAHRVNFGVYVFDDDDPPGDGGGL